MTLKSDVKFEEKLTCGLENGSIYRGIWQIFTRALGSLKTFSFNGFLLSKVYIVGAKKVQRSYLS